MNQDTRFPDGFLWGAAAAAYQIEGSPLADGAGASIWHRFSHTPGMTRDGDTGDIACDHYRRFKEDVALMRDLGLKAYRFSIAWGRVLPEGTGKVNLAGLGFYERLVETLLQHGITPMATLYHWDLPAALDDRGGWLNPDSAHWFADYARIVFRALDDRVPMWATLNEPWVITDGGYLTGVLAPGHRSFYEPPIASHNLLRAHGAAVEAYRGEGSNKIGLVVNLEPKYPASSSPEDLAATRIADAYMNRQYLDPVLLGRYPEEMKQIWGDAWRDWPARDFDSIGQKLDFLGINYYTRSVTRYDPASLPLRASAVKQDALHTETNWEVCPQALTDVLNLVRERYPSIPLYITENGAAFADPASSATPLPHDTQRVAYLQSHLRAVHAAIQAGCDVRGYFVWSLLDNLEWAHGYSKRFGIVHVDYATQQRTPKASAQFYRSVIESNGAALFS